MPEETHKFEAKILWQSDKSYLIEMTIPIQEHYKFFLPKSDRVTLDHYESNGDGNWMFEVSDWWYRKVLAGDFWADENR